MRLKAGHVVVAVIVLVTLFVFLATWRNANVANPDDMVAGALPPSGAPQDQVPSLAVDTKDVDLGVIPNDGEGHGTLIVRNTGKGPLDVTEVRSSCACTSGVFPPGTMPIAPSGSAELKIKVDPRRIYGFDSKKTLTLYSNDPARPSLAVTVSAKVDPEFVLEPPEFDFGTMAKGEAVKREIRLVSRLDKPFTVSAVSGVQPGSDETPPVGLQLELAPVPENEWKTPGHCEYVIRAGIGPDMPSGPFNFGAYISFDLKRFPFLRIPVTGTVEAPYKVEMPTELGMVVLQPGAEDARVKITAQAPVEFEGATAENGATTVSSHEIPGGFELVFVPAANLVPGRHDDSVHVRLRMGDKTYEELLKVRVFTGAVGVESKDK